jgi:eukaryotic-like serine/threonine-protein kinase
MNEVHMSSSVPALNPRERELFIQALEQPSPRARQAFLDRACDNDVGLRRRLDALLDRFHQLGTFLENPVIAVPGEVRQAGEGDRGMSRPTLVVPVTEQPGDRIGRYKLIEKIGEGGCGVVYLAQQEEPVRRRVALKVIKLGMDTRQVVARFEAERQALAMMDHPNIAKVFDAGATETGRPYFVMELVRGVRMTEFCDQNCLSTDERLKLFVQVCRALQHAHQKGVIHRDIKPSNILVMVADDVPVPKMIDFGIAKAIGERLTDKTVFTRFEQFIGTPVYMSPEQAGLSGLDIDTRSDIYALGVLLYELLTGRAPFEPKELAQAGLDEIIRRIREEEPAKPSTRLSRLEQQEQTTTAQRRSTEAPKLIRSLRGDLDWVVMKCLEKNRTRRYETANDLARDIECHLSQQPVSAAAPTLRYRAMKYLRRHRRVLATAAGFVLLLILGTALGLWQARRAGQVKWALETALPQIGRQLAKDDYTNAFKLIEEARPFIADNPQFQEHSARVVSVISIETTPPGAQVFIREYNDLTPKWEPIGKSPLKGIKMPRGPKHWKAILPGYELAEGALVTGPREGIKVQLDKVGTLAPGMVRVHGTQGEKWKPDLGYLDSESLPGLKISDFLLDRYEATNRRFKEFVDAGGYQKPEYWKHKFVKNGLELSWAEAMKLFVDHTGKPGPATWRNGDFPKDEQDCPVGGVSWYEAAAFAEWAGLRLPTVYHWKLAAGDTEFVDVGFILPLSNFEGKGPAKVGKYQGMTYQGIYDMAGNVKEWCFNGTPDGSRVIAGGGWNEASCMFGFPEEELPLVRKETFGFRCMKLLLEDGVWEQAGCSVRCHPPFVLGDHKPPCSDEEFRAWARFYYYPKGELQPANEAKENLGAYTLREKVSFNAAYPNERMTAYLFLPRTAKRPFQTLVLFPAASAWLVPSIDDYVSRDVREAAMKRGRACVIPVLQGTFERRKKDQKPQFDLKQNAMTWAKDYLRTLDYLETRPQDFDTNRIAFVGTSSGAFWGAILPAIEPRIKLVVMEGCAFFPDLPEECSQVNFAHRIKIPILLQGALYDPQYPVEQNQKPFLKLFATPEKDKRHTTYETGHYIWGLNQYVQDQRAFLDDYFGRPAN